MKILLPILGILFLSACSHEQKTNVIAEKVPLTDTAIVKADSKTLPAPTFIDEPPTPEQIKTEASDRIDILKNLATKRANKTPIIIHVFIPLADNKYQGIVPVPALIGNGQDARNNLYWGALYGIKTHFTKSAKWDRIHVQKDLTANVLERAIFKRTLADATPVYLIADAYDGQRMEQCLTDYFDAMAGTRLEQITVGEEQISVYSHADLLVFNGHNGLMDVFDLPQPLNQDGRHKDAVMIACVSYNYFVHYLLKAGGYPLVTTTHLLAPEGYVLHHILEAWLGGKTAEEIRYSAAVGYHKYQKCGMRGASNLFKTGY